MKKIVFTILSVLLLGFIWVNHSKYQRKFDSERWKEWIESEDQLNLRWQMVGPLTLLEKINGKTKEQLLDLLGEPTNKETNKWYYKLGPTGRGINYGGLRIQFEQNKSVNYKVIEH